MGMNGMHYAQFVNISETYTLLKNLYGQIFNFRKKKNKITLDINMSDHKNDSDDKTDTLFVKPSCFFYRVY